MAHGMENDQGRGRAVGALVDRRGPASSSAEGWEWLLLGIRMWHESAAVASPGEVSRVSVMSTPGGLWTVSLSIGSRSWSSLVRSTPEEAMADALSAAGGAR